jgi:hypothetical protein
MAKADDAPGDIAIHFVNNSKQTIWVNGGSGTWDKVDWGPAFNSPQAIPPGGNVSGPLRWKGGVTKPDGTAGYAFGSTATAQQSTNICYISFIADQLKPGPEIPYNDQVPNAYHGGWTYVKTSNINMLPGYHVGVSNGPSGQAGHSLTVSLDPD